MLPGRHQGKAGAAGTTGQVGVDDLVRHGRVFAVQPGRDGLAEPGAVRFAPTLSPLTPHSSVVGPPAVRVPDDLAAVGQGRLAGWGARSIRLTVMDELTHLLLRATGDDPDALNEFVVAAQPDVWRFCAALLNADQADDATQETFARAWRAAAGFRGDASARTWLLAIAKRVCYDAVRQRSRSERRQQRLQTAAERRNAPDPGESVVIADLLGRLDHDRRSAFVLTQLLGLSYEEAAAVVDCPIGTIRSRVARARGDLQAALENESPAARMSSYEDRR
jgi:RNA polymerase sigma-70 factor, ECF subfamily